MSGDLVQYQGSLAGAAMSVQEIKAQRALIRDVMQVVMVEGTHYGTIPGCGDKKVLYKTGGETLMSAFRLSNAIESHMRDLPGDHREYEVMVQIISPSGLVLATGVGSCSTMESKYRYRHLPVKLTEREVPQDYWNIRKSDPIRAQQLLGGSGFSVKKSENGKYMIAERGEQVENSNPADEWNTVLKLAEKRAFLSALMKALAVSDIFIPDGGAPNDEGGQVGKGNQQGAGRRNSPKKGVTLASAEQLVEIQQTLQSSFLQDSERARVEDDIRRGFTETLAADALKWLRGLIAERDGSAEGKGSRQ